MKILHVISGDLWAGAETQVWQLCQRLVADGHEVFAVVLNEGVLAKALRDSGVGVTVLDETRISFLDSIKQLRDLLKSIAVDVAHSHGYKENVLLSLSCILHSSAPKLFLTQHGQAEFDVPWSAPHKKLVHWLAHRLSRSMLSQIVAVTSEIATQLKREYGEHKVRYIGNGIDVGAINAKVSQQLGDMAPGRKRVAMLGRLVNVKRHDIAISVMELMAQAGEEGFVLEFWGDGPLREELELLVDTKKLRGRIEFKGHTSAPAQVLSEIDLLLFVSDHEGMPMTVLEAMALRCPVLAHNVGGLNTLLKDDAGILVNAHTPEAYKADILRFLKMEEDEVRRLTDKAYQRVKAEYDIAIISSYYIDMYKAQLSS